ncbi:MAG: hypothetical protein WCR46_18290 [Deltaproteobacteria bacterium]|jgi:2-iminoacetate synthase ThiH
MQKLLRDVRLPLEGRLDLTYRCNNHCRHCWLRIPPGDPERNRELSFDEIRSIVDQARALGTRRWCPVYGWLEHGRFSAPVEHLCAVAGESKKFKEDWQANHRRYFQIAGITIQVDSDLPIDDHTFHPKFASFRADGPCRGMQGV